MAEANGDDSASLTRLNEIGNPSSLKAWSDVDDVQCTSQSSLNIDSCTEISKQTYQLKTNNELCIPPELMEKIVYYFDGKTLLQFKLLSKTCNAIANNVLRYNRIWKKICLKEIPKKYFIDLLNKRLGTFIPLDSLSENQYEGLYKHWLRWQITDFNITNIREEHFLGYDEISKIICHKFDVKVVCSKYTCIFSLLKNEKNAECYEIKQTESKPKKPLTLLMLNPQPQANMKGEELNLYIAYRQVNTNVCPLHNNMVNKVHDGNIRGHYAGNLIDVDANIYVSVCCWVREKWYEWHSNVQPNVINGHHCQKLSGTMYTSVVHGVIISHVSTNTIIIHDIYKDSCVTVHSWLNHKHIGATAVYIYTDILFVGTQNGYLLAYRLQCWDDLINLKKKNMLLETRLSIGHIISLDIMDFENIKAILVASMSSVLWIKVS